METGSEPKTKRYRGNNFTKEEELLLLSEIEKYKEIIECKLTDKINTCEKNEAWQKILAGFNSNNNTHRNLEQLKIKYDNLKCKTRKIVAINKNYFRNSEDTRKESVQLDPVIEAVVRIINKSSLIGLPICDVETELIEIKPEIEPVQQMQVLNRSASEEKEDISLNYIERQRVGNKFNFKPKLWKNDSSKKNLIPKSRMVRKVTNPIKSSFYYKKLELLDEKIQKEKLQQETILLNQRKNEEEHQRKMFLLDLDIKIKEKLLKQ